MIVVTANWAIGDGTLAPAVSPSLHGLAAAIHRAVVRAGVRADGVYRPIDRLDLVLAGDTFDWLLSGEWLGGVKPWHGSVASREVASRIARRSFHCGRAALVPLIRWARQGLEVPAARCGGRHVGVPVRISILTGDRDDAVEELLAENRDVVSVGRRWDDGRVTIRHGHEFDPVCAPMGDGMAGTCGRPPTLAESVTVDLVARFGAMLGPEGRPLVRRLTSVGVLRIPREIAAWLAAQGAGSRARIGNDWRKTVDAWWRQARRSVPTAEVEFDAVDALAAWFQTAAADAGRLCPRAAGLSGLLPGSVPGAVGTVFGHLDGDGASGSAVGLAGEPRTVACRTARGWPRWESIVEHEVGSAVITIRHPGIESTGGDRVIDAA